MSIKRTYSRRNMTMAPSAYSSPPEDNLTTNSNKRYKVSQRDGAETGTRSMGSGNPVRQMPPLKRFGGPVSMQYHEMDVDEIPTARKPTQDPFTRIYNDCKAGVPTAERNVGSLHGSREAFDSLVEAKKLGKGQLKHGGNADVGALGESSKIFEKGVPKPAKHATIRPTHKAAGPSDPKNVLARKMEVLATVMGVFETREYLSPSSSPPSADLYRKSIDAQSKEATLWSKNQADSSLLRLPKNVRKKIYQLALGNHDIEIFFRNYRAINYNNGRVDRVPHFKYGSIVCKEIRRPSSRNTLPRIEKTRGMSLLNGVCRQLYLETATLPYELNNITFRAPNAMFNFIFRECRLTTQQLEAITELTVQQDLPGQSVLTLLPNLKRVRLLAEEQDMEKKSYPFCEKSVTEWTPPSGGLYHVVEGRKGRKLEQESTWTGYRKNWTY